MGMYLRIVTPPPQSPRYHQSLLIRNGIRSRFNLEKNRNKDEAVVAG
jgi:hypothetical protein